MARSIYATFRTEHDAERATGALIDHGIPAVDISFVVSDTLMHPTVFHPNAPAVPGNPTTAAPVDAAPPPPVRLPGTYPQQPPPVPAATVAPGTAPVAAPAPLQAHEVHHAATLPANTPEELVYGEHRPHIIDMESERPRAADGISTTTAGDAAKGAVGGAGIGVGLGILLGIAAVTVPGVGLVAGAGALIASLVAATGIAGGIAGGVYGYLADLGVPDNHARILSDHLKEGGILLHVEVSGTIPEAEILAILTKYGATSAEGF